MMVAWEQSKLGDLIETQKGFAFKSGWYTDFGRPIVKVSNFTDDSVDSSGLDCIPEDIASAYLKYKLKADDVVVQTVGSWPTNPASVVGKCVLIPSTVAGALLNQNAVKLSPTKNINAKFLYYLLRSDHFKSYIISTAQGAASQAAITLEAIRAFEFMIPPLSAQQRIAGILSAYDELIENNQRRIRILEDMARSLYREWFVHFRYPGHESVPPTESILGPIPQGWEVKKIAELLAKVSRQGKIKTQNYLQIGELPVIDQGRELVGGYTNDADIEYSGELPVIVFGDHTRILKFIDFPFACGADGTQLLRSNDERMPVSLFYYTLSAIELSDFAYARHFKFLKEELVVVPIAEVATAFSERVDPIKRQVRLLQQQSDNLRRTRDLLLPRLLSGQVNLGEAES